MTEKIKYRCYYTAYVNNFGEISLKKYPIGETFAESERKAISNIKHRLRKQYKNGVNSLNIIAMAAE